MTPRFIRMALAATLLGGTMMSAAAQVDPPQKPDQPQERRAAPPPAARQAAPPAQRVETPARPDTRRVGDDAPARPARPAAPTRVEAPDKPEAPPRRAAEPKPDKPDAPRRAAEPKPDKPDAPRRAAEQPDKPDALRRAAEPKPDTPAARPGAPARPGTAETPARPGQAPTRADKPDAPDRPAREVTVTTEQRKRVQDTLTRQKVRAERNVNFNVSVGVNIPRTTRLRPLPPAIVSTVPQYRGYEYVLVEDEYVIVEPETRRIVEVIPARGGAQVGERRGAPRKLVMRDRMRGEIIAFARQAPSIALPGATLIVGASVPAGTELREFSAELIAEFPELEFYRYIVVDGDVFLVDPIRMEVVATIDI